MISYIIPYRQASSDRARNLGTVLQWLQPFNFEVIVVEQDRKPCIPDDLASSATHYVFTENKGLFNRCWGFNVGIRASNGELLVFGDADLIMRPELIERMANELANFEAVSPYDYIVDLTEQETATLDPRMFDYKVNKVSRNPVNFSGGVVAYTRQAIDKIHWWDERFEGWGGEDDIQYLKTAQLLTHKTLVGECFHLNHSRARDEGTDQHGNYARNYALYNYYTNNPSKVIEDLQPIDQLGKNNKYQDSVIT